MENLNLKLILSAVISFMISISTNCQDQVKVMSHFNKIMVTLNSSELIRSGNYGSEYESVSIDEQAQIPAGTYEGENPSICFNVVNQFMITEFSLWITFPGAKIPIYRDSVAISGDSISLSSSSSNRVYTVKGKFNNNLGIWDGSYYIWDKDPWGEILSKSGTWTAELSSANNQSELIFDAYKSDNIFMKFTGNEDYNKVMLLLINNTSDSIDLHLPEGVTTFTNPCDHERTYSFYTPKRIDINLLQQDEFILINQIGTTLIESGSCLFTDTHCRYHNFTTVFRSYYDPILDDTLQEIHAFNPDTSTLQQVKGHKNGYLLVLRNYDNKGMKSRYIYVDEAKDGEKYEKFTSDWRDSAFISLSSHDFIVEIDSNHKKLISLENPAIQITNTGVKGASSDIFTVIIDLDIIPPVLAIIDNQLYRPDLIEATSSEDGIIYLVPENTDKELGAIKAACIDSVLAYANSAVAISLTGLQNGNYWLYARDVSQNISEAIAFNILGVGIEEIISDQLRIYPNPFNDLLTIETQAGGKHIIEIISLDGRIIQNMTFAGRSCRADLSSLQQGVYQITIRSKDVVRTRKIVKF
jgi:hypothetical protein